MTIPPQSQLRISFGPFEVHAATGELRKRGIRVHLSGQPFQLLLALLSRPGELVTREQLRNQIWPDGTFVDFEGGLNAAMNKLRRALNDSADNPRYIETTPGLGYRFIGVIEHATPIAVPAPSGRRPSSLPKLNKPSISIWWWSTAAFACFLSFVFGWSIHSRTPVSSSWTLTRLTSDAGLADMSALSPDGKLVAYSSNRGFAGEKDLYIKQVAGGEPIRLTFDGQENTAPDFTPDGSKIVFHSNRNGGGIYEIPAFGGESRLLARGGFDPKVSPDGDFVAYWIGGENVANSVPGSGAVYIVPIGAGPPRRIAPTLSAARFPIWSPDSKRILFVGYSSSKAFDSSALDWWVAPIDGGPEIRTGEHEALVRAGLEKTDYTNDPSSRSGVPTIPKPSCWTPGGSILFSLRVGATQNLWESAISSKSRVSGLFKNVTKGAGNESDPSCPVGNTVTFTNSEVRRDVWLLPFDLNLGKPTSELARITESPAYREYSALSGNGKSAAFCSSQSGRLNVWVRELATGKELHVAESSSIQRFPLLNKSGGRIAFSVYEPKGVRAVYLSTLGGAVEKLCEGCLRATDRSRDEKSLLTFGGNPYRIDLLDIASRKQTSVLTSKSNLLYARFSPDNRWISFTMRLEPNRTRIMIAPFDPTKPTPESAWIQVAESGAEDWANWSPDEKVLYFTSARDGHICLWAQRIDAVSHRPLGEPFAAQHLHGHWFYRQGSGWWFQTTRLPWS